MNQLEKYKKKKLLKKLVFLFIRLVILEKLLKNIK